MSSVDDQGLLAFFGLGHLHRLNDTIHGVSGPVFLLRIRVNEADSPFLPLSFDFAGLGLLILVGRAGVPPGAGANVPARQVCKYVASCTSVQCSEYTAGEPAHPAIAIPSSISSGRLSSRCRFEDPLEAGKVQ